MNKKLVAWHIGGFFFIFVLASALHFAFELSNFQNMFVAFFSAVNESTWEHLKMVFWSGLLFMLIDHRFVKDLGNNYLIAKVASFIVTQLVICITWYAYTPLTECSIFEIDICLCMLAIATSQVISYLLMRARPIAVRLKTVATIVLVLMIVMFSTFTFFPPRIFLFEHMELEQTGQYGILEDYGEMRYFNENE